MNWPSFFRWKTQQAEAVLLPVVDVLLDLLPGRLFRERLAVCGERLHYLGIREQAVEIVEVQGA